VPYLLAAALCAVYALTHTTHFNGDGLAEVANVVQNNGYPVVTPRYALYFPLLGLLAGHRPVVDALGYIRLLQSVNTVLAGVALLLVFRLVTCWAHDRRLAVAVMASVGVSFAFWERAVDVKYVMFGFTALLLSLVVPAALVRRRVPLPAAAALSGLGAMFAALCYLGNVAAWPALLWTLWDGYASATRRARVAALLWFGGAVLLVVACCAAVSIHQGYVSGPLAFVRWFTWRNQYPGWSEFNDQTPRRAVNGFLCGIQNFYTGLKLRDLLHGQVTWALLPAQLSLGVAILVVFTVPFAWLRAGRRLWREAPGLWAFCALWFAGAAVFDSYQAADDPQFWINTLVPFYVMAFLSLRSLFRRDLFLGVPVLLLLGNLAAPIWAWHDPGYLVDVRSAISAGRFLGPRDLVISPGYDWTQYLPVFAQRSQFTLIGLADRDATPLTAQARLRARVQAVRSAGGHVYLSDLDDTTPLGWRWMQDVTRLPPQALLGHAGPVCWTDGRRKLWEYRP
jgi:hypothetical protein